MSAAKENAALMSLSIARPHESNTFKGSARLQAFARICWGPGIGHVACERPALGRSPPDRF